MHGAPAKLHNQTATSHNPRRGRCPHRPATMHPQNRTVFVDLPKPPNLRRGGVLPLPAVQCRKFVCTNAGQDVLRCRRPSCEFVFASCAGGVEPRPYGVSDNIPFLRYVAANLLLPNGRTESSAPTGAYRSRRHIQKPPHLRRLFLTSSRNSAVILRRGGRNPMALRYARSCPRPGRRGRRRRRRWR